MNGLASGGDCHCDSCNWRYAASQRPQRRPAWITTPGWGAWDGHAYANSPDSPAETAQDAREYAGGYQEAFAL